MTLKVTASDASGIRSIRVRVGRARAKTYPRAGLRVRLSAKVVRITVVVTDKAGNARTLTKTLRPRR